MEQLNLNKRENNVAHSARKERKAGKVPGVIYGKKIGNLLFEIGKLELDRELSIVGEHGALNFNIDGYNGTAIIKEIQKDAVSHDVIHVDLEEVTNTQPIQAEVPVRFIGKEFLNTKGIVLQSQNDLVKVSCMPDELPSTIDIDVTNAKPGKTYRFADLEVASEISIVGDLSTILASVMGNHRSNDYENEISDNAEIVINSEKSREF